QRLDSISRPIVTALVDSARAAALPTEPLVQRALEGTTKRATPDRIVAAVRRLALDLGHARDALGPTASPTELVAAAAALRAGAPPATLTELRRIRRESLTVPLAVLTDLVGSGVPVDSAAAAVLSLAAQARDADLVEFRRAVALPLGCRLRLARPALGTADRHAHRARYIPAVRERPPQPAGPHRRLVPDTSRRASLGG